MPEQIHGWPNEWECTFISALNKSNLEELRNALMVLFAIFTLPVSLQPLSLSLGLEEKNLILYLK